MIDYIDSREDQKIKVGEKLIFILDKCEDYIDTKYIAQFFCAFLEKKITYDEFLKGSRIIQNIFIGDLEYFLDSDISEFEKEASTEEAPDEDTFPLINIGICGFGYNPINIEDQWDHKMTNKYIVEGGETIIWVTSIGHKLKEIFKLSDSCEINQNKTCFITHFILAFLQNLNRFDFFICTSFKHGRIC